MDPSPKQDAPQNVGQRQYYGSYNLPDDEQERNRLDLQHECYRASFGGKLYLSPLQNPRSVLDVGTGTGIWGIEVAQEFPQAEVLGLDINPTPPQATPDNFKYVVSNFEDPWPVEKGQTDFVHGRMVLIGLKNHRKFIHEAFESLIPGGWFELQDVQLPYMGTSGLMAEWNDYIMEGNERLGVNMVATDSSWDRWLQEEGFDNIKHEKFRWPLGAVSNDPEATELSVKARQNLLDGLEAFSTITFMKGLGWSKSKLDAYLPKIRGAIENLTGETYIPIHAIYAQKPMAT